MIDETMRWLAATLPPADAASCFLDRHRDDPMARHSELQAFLDWARPTLSVNTPAAVPALRTSLLLGVPASPDGEVLYNSVSDLASEESFSGCYDPSTTFLRVAAHPSLTRLLPNWIAGVRKAYEAACQGRHSPSVLARMPSTGAQASLDR
jgi:hypothetical protein